MTRHYITTEVEVDLDNFDDEDLIEVLQDRGYKIVKNHEAWVSESVWKLYQDWLHDEGDNDRRFDKSLRKFFSEQLNKNIL
jgi:hypothetical protein